MIEITAIELAPAARAHGQIGSVRWRDTQSRDAGQSTSEAVIDWLRESNANQAVVEQGDAWMYVWIVDPGEGAPFLRSHSEGVWNDKLLTLPRY